MSAHVTVSRRPLWRLRLGPALTRGLLRVAAVAGLLASARFAVDPPRAAGPRPAAPERADLAGEGYATLFTRRYLTWDAGDPEAHQRGLAPFVGTLDADAGLRLPAGGRQSVAWAEVVQWRAESAAERVYTVAAQTDSGGLLYVSVPVWHRSGGLALAGYPALVGAPAAAPASDAAAGLRDVSDTALAAVVGRALGNYLAGAASELDADLAPAARVSLPSTSLTLQGVQQLKWSTDGRSVFAVVAATGPSGVQYTLGYELDVARAAGRWEISAIQMDPDT